MKKLFTTAAIVCLACLGPASLRAQVPLQGPPGPPQPNQPAVSPYINLLRNNNPTYLNYYGLVRPQVAFQGQINGLQQQYAAGQSAAYYTDPATGLAVTGHPALFFNTSHYFFNRGGAGGAAAAGMTGAARGASGGAAPANRGASGGAPPAIR